MASKFRGVHPKVVIEKEYYRALRRGYLDPYLQGLWSLLQTLGDDATNQQWVNALHEYNQQWERTNALDPEAIGESGAGALASGGVIAGAVGRAVSSWLERTARVTNADFARDIIRVAKVDVRPILQFAPIREVLIARARENIKLIETIHPRFTDTLTRALLRERLTGQLIAGETAAPMDQEARENMFRRTAKSSGYNLRRITRDQTNKLTGQINQANQEHLGIETYRWQTSDDDRVRDTHRSKDDAIFRWDSPPPDTGHPGEDIQCRCVAIPEISLDELKRRFG